MLIDRDTAWLLADVLRPSIDDATFQCIASHDNRLAVIVLRPVGSLAEGEVTTAVRLHACIGRGLLVVV